MSKTKILLAGLAMVALAGAGCVKQVSVNKVAENKTTQSRGVITIGGIIPSTGVAAEYGANEIEAINLAVEEINKAGGVLGKDLKVVLEDTKCDAKEGANAVTKLININKVDVVASFECSGPTFSGAPVTESNKKVFMAAVATAPGLAEKGNYIFRVTPNDAAQGKDLAEAVYAKGYQKTAVIYVNNDYGLGVKKVFEANFKGKVVAAEAVATDASDFKTNLTKIKGYSPDSVLLVLLGKQYVTTFKQMKELGLNAQIFGSETFKDDSILKDIGSLAENVFATHYSSPISSVRDAWVVSMKSKYGKEPGVFADFAYDLVMVYSEAIKKAGATDSDSIKTALQALKYNGVTGVTEFDSDGEVKGKSFSLYVVKNGKFELAK